MLFDVVANGTFPVLDQVNIRLKPIILATTQKQTMAGSNGFLCIRQIKASLSNEAYTHIKSWALTYFQRWVTHGRRGRMCSGRDTTGS